MLWSTILESAARLAEGTMFPVGLLWVALWPARHALLTVTLVLMYVHRYEPESDEDPFTF
jgi:hypothetical protein